MAWPDRGNGFRAAFRFAGSSRGAGDLADIAAAIAPRPVLIQAAVDGRNRPLTLAEMKHKAAPVSWNATLREESEPRILADWIGAHLR
jgi:hypothetical protein